MKPDFFDWHLTDEKPFILQRHDFPPRTLSNYLDFHRSIHLLLLISGDCGMEIGRNDIHVPDGFLLTAPWELHGKQHSVHGCSLLMTAIRQENLYGAMLGESGKLKSIIRLPSDVRHALLRGYLGADLTEQCVRQLQNSSSVLEQWHALVGFFVRVVSAIPSHAIPEQEQEMNFELVPAFQRLYECRGRKFSAEDGARACGMSTSRFRLLFKKTTGMPFGEYELQFRLNLALELMKKRTSSLKSIAGELGFHDVSHFSHAFRKYFGKPPAQYLKAESCVPSCPP